MRSYGRSEDTSPAVRRVASGTRTGHLYGLKPEAQPLLVASSSLRSVGSTIPNVEVITSEVRGC